LIEFFLGQTTGLKNSYKKDRTVGFGTRNRTWQRGRGRRQFPHLGNGGSSPGVLAKSLARKSICDLYLALGGAQLASPLLHGSHNQNCGCHSRNGV